MQEPYTFTVLVGKRGIITIPAKVREEHSIADGDVLKITDNGQGHKLEIEVIHATGK